MRGHVAVRFVKLGHFKTKKHPSIAKIVQQVLRVIQREPKIALIVLRVLSGRIAIKVPLFARTAGSGNIKIAREQRNVVIALTEPLVTRLA